MDDDTRQMQIEMAEKAFAYHLSVAIDMRERANSGADSTWIPLRYLGAVFSLMCEVEAMDENDDRVKQIPPEILADVRSVTWDPDRGFSLRPVEPGAQTLE